MSVRAITSNKVLEVLHSEVKRQGVSVTTRDVANRLQWNLDRVRRQLKKLVDEGVVCFTGNESLATWWVDDFKMIDNIPELSFDDMSLEALSDRVALLMGWRTVHHPILKYEWVDVDGLSTGYNGVWSIWNPVLDTPFYIGQAVKVWEWLETNCPEGIYDFEVAYVGDSRGDWWVCFYSEQLESCIEFYGDFGEVICKAMVRAVTLASGN